MPFGPNNRELAVQAPRPRFQDLVGDSLPDQHGSIPDPNPPSAEFLLSRSGGRFALWRLIAVPGLPLRVESIVERPHWGATADRLLLAGTSHSASSLTAAAGQPGDHAEGSLSGSAANSQSRP